MSLIKPPRLAGQGGKHGLTASEKPDAKGSGHAGRYGEILDVKLLSADGREIGSPPRAEDVYVRIRFRTYRARMHDVLAHRFATVGQAHAVAAHVEQMPVEDARRVDALLDEALVAGAHVSRGSRIVVARRHRLQPPSAQSRGTRNSV